MRKLLIVLVLVVGCSADDPRPSTSSDVSVEDDVRSERDMESSEDTDRRDTTDSGLNEDAASDSAADQNTNCEPTPSTTREGHTSDGWRWEKKGRLFADDPVPANANEGDFAPTIIRHNGEYRVYFSRRRGAGFSIWTTTSPDGVTWSDPTAITGFDSDSYTSAIVDGNDVKMWFGSGSFEYAASTDGLTFGARASGILRPSDVGGFASISMIYPEVQPDGDGFRMWFTGFDGETLRLGTATSDDEVNWTANTTPILERTGGTNFDSTSVGQPDVLKIGETWYMWYGGYDTSNTDPGPWRIGLATSSDGVSFERVGVSIPLVENGDDMWSTRDASVIETDDGFLMVYTGMRDDSHYRLLMATSDACP